MSVGAIRTSDFLLMFRRDGTDLVRLLPNALEVTQSSRKKLEQKYLGCEVVSRNGRSREILKFKIGQMHNSLLPTWLSWLSMTGARQLDVRFSDEKQISVSELQEPLLKYLRTEAHVDEWADSEPTFRALISNLQSAETIDQVFALIEHASPDRGGLDVLV